MKNNYIIIGDSIVYGIGDCESNGWTSMFKNYIMSLDEGSISCSNYVHIVGFPGAVSNDISLRIRGILETFRFDGVNNEVILSIGINSCKSVNKNIKEYIDVFSKNFIDIISQVKISRIC